MVVVEERGACGSVDGAHGVVRRGREWEAERTREERDGGRSRGKEGEQEGGGRCFSKGLPQIAHNDTERRYQLARPSDRCSQMYIHERHVLKVHPSHIGAAILLQFPSFSEWACGEHPARGVPSRLGDVSHHHQGGCFLRVCGARSMLPHVVEVSET